MPGRRCRRRTKAEWRAVFRRFQSSGLSRRDFCQREGLALSSFQRWRSLTAEREVEGEFVELRPSTTPAVSPAGWTLELSLPNGASIRLRG